MKWDEVASKWKDLTGSAKENWCRLTDHDLEEISGRREQLAGNLQELYGITKREADKQVWDWGKSVERHKKTTA